MQAQHILIKFKAGDSASEAESLKKIQALAQRAKTEDFGKLAQESSEDMGSKVKGGDLGTFSRGRMVPEFEKAAFSQAEGTVGDPVKSTYGYHLIKVNKHIKASEPSFTDVQNKVARKMLLSDKLAGLEAALRDGKAEAVEDTLKAWKVKWDETGPVELGSDTLIKIPSKQVTQEVFLLSQAHPMPRRIIVEGNSRYILKFKSASAEVAKAESVKDETTGRERGADLYSRWIEEYRKTASIERNSELSHEP